MAKSSVLGRAARRGLLIVLAALAGAIIYLWLFRGPGDTHNFDKIYRASVAQASGNFRLAAALGVPIQASEEAAKYHFYNRDGHRHVHFQFPLRGSKRGSLIVGDAVKLGDNWLIVRLVATFPGHAIQINLSPGTLT